VGNTWQYDSAQVLYQALVRILSTMSAAGERTITEAKQYLYRAQLKLSSISELLYWALVRHKLVVKGKLMLLIGHEY